MNLGTRGKVLALILLALLITATVIRGMNGLMDNRCMALALFVISMECGMFFGMANKKGGRQ
jgi:hypothetical protein